MLRRLFDVLFALIWWTLTAPAMLIIAICIKLDSPGPILYIPKMVGYKGTVFPLFRFRTMYIDRFTDRNGDDRVTHVGHFIRNYSLDHLPTLINLLTGDITIIGPRPMEGDRVDLHDPRWQTYFEVKPGLFSYAVLKMGKSWTPSRVSHPERNQELEMEYIRKRSPRFDTYLLLRSLYAHIRSKGNVKARKEPDADIHL
jgi:lipopolysaccharide/colanic/teichoic acid biosynthesis glycosyltransferase